ncbi:O-antigen ligase family protein [Clostridium gasigenes]|uniref:O-antigen ligase family protein n=1 Tax=Clostridium gasigenes TaxID=94869 RepID=A0A7X0VPR9_9CLOT|nr:O-antigen ligase family protein [Clostridium gasigenes]MBB6713549.1 O-antigen ligase family protein [Clostridium gasigenes]
MKSYKKLNNLILLLFIILYPILPSYGKYTSDIILYILIFINITGFIFIKKERHNVIRNIKNISKDKLFLSLIFLNLTMYISVFAAMNKRLTITNSIRFSLYLFIFYLISYTVKNKKQISVILTAFISTAILSSLLSIYQIVKIAIIGDPIDKAHRISSFLENSNNLGAYTILSIFIVIMFMIKCNKKSTKIFFGFLSLLLLINIISSQSRNALIGLLIGSLLVSILYDKRFIILSIILPIILFIIPQSRLRILQIFDPKQNLSRFRIWESAKMMIKDNPISGIGYENFQINYPIYVADNKETLLVWDGFRTLHPHNIFLKIQSELGILGTIAFILFIFISILTLINLINKHTDKNSSTLLIGITSGFIAFQFMNLIDNFYGAPKVILSMFVILGISNYYKLEWYNR